MPLVQEALSAPDWIRTSDRPLRRRMLYPAELRALVLLVSGWMDDWGEEKSQECMWKKWV